MKSSFRNPGLGVVKGQGGEERSRPAHHDHTNNFKIDMFLNRIIDIFEELHESFGVWLVGLGKRGGWVNCREWWVNGLATWFFLGIVLSILALEIVIEEVIKQIFANPSCITTAARSALAAGSQASSSLSNTITSQQSFSNRIDWFNSISIVWYWPIYHLWGRRSRRKSWTLTNSFSSTFLPVTRKEHCSESNSILSILIFKFIFIRLLFVDPVVLSLTTYPWSSDRVGGRRSSYISYCTRAKSIAFCHDIIKMPHVLSILCL